MWDNMAWASLAKHQWHPIRCDETNSLTCLWWWRCWANSKLGHLWWCACTSWLHLAKANSCLHCNWCIGSAPSSNLSDNMCMVLLGIVELETHWCIVSMMNFKCVLVIMHMKFPKYMFNPSWTCFLSSRWWVGWMGWIACVRSMTCMLLNPLHAINNTAHHVYSLSAARMDL